MLAYKIRFSLSAAALLTLLGALPLGAAMPT